MTFDAHDSPSSRGRPLRVLTDDCYPVPFNILRGQRNAVFSQRRLSRHHRTCFPTFNIQAVTLERAWGFDLLHTFNAVPLRSWAPFVVTFEDVAPRVWDDPRYPQHAAMREHLIDLLLGRRCLGLIAMSQYALRMLERQHAGDPRWPALRRKVQQIYPSVTAAPPAPPAPPAPAPRDGTLRLVFVGHDFLRKGVPVVTRAHARLLRQGVPVWTTIISRLAWHADDYVGPSADYDVEGERARLNQPGIEHIPDLPHAQVLQRLAEAHFTLLPTLHDTFGYSALESLACGTPVLATNTCALPELIEDGVSGGLLPLESEGRVGEWRGLGQRWQPGYADLYRQTVDRLGELLAERALQYWEARRAHPALRAAAAERFAGRLGPDQARGPLEALYEQCRPWTGWWGQARALISVPRRRAGRPPVRAAARCSSGRPDPSA